MTAKRAFQKSAPPDEAGDLRLPGHSAGHPRGGSAQSGDEWRWADPEQSGSWKLTRPLMETWQQEGWRPWWRG